MADRVRRSGGDVHRTGDLAWGVERDQVGAGDVGDVDEVRS
jgi:hypothetical protein